MTYKEESYVLDTLSELEDRARSTSDLKLLIEEVHENNIMLKQIVRVLNTWISNANQENENDFGRNVLANIVSSVFDLGRLRVN